MQVRRLTPMHGFGAPRTNPSQEPVSASDRTAATAVADELTSLKVALEEASSARKRNRLLEQSLGPLAGTGDPAALEFIAEVAKDPHCSGAVRRRAIDALRRAGPPAGPYVRELIDAGVSDTVLPWALAETGSESDTDLLVPFLRHRGLRRRVNAVVALDQLGAPHTHEGFGIALRDRRLFVRASAMSALRERCSDAELLEALHAAKRATPWYRLMAHRYFTLWARKPSAREAHRARHPPLDEFGPPSAR